MRANFKEMICDARVFVYEERHVSGFVSKHRGPSFYRAAAEAGPASARSRGRESPGRPPPE